MLRPKTIIYAAKGLSVVFHPLYLPLVGLLALFTLSYLSLLPLMYKLIVLAQVAVFTILIPRILIRLYRRFQGWSLMQLGQRERRMVPYCISIASYMACVYLMQTMHIPHFMGSILIAALVIQTTCAMLNTWWKVSVHTAAIGGVAGALFAFGEIFLFNPRWWLCLVIVIAGLLGSARMILRQHSLNQVVGGFAIGLIAAATVILWI